MDPFIGKYSLIKVCSGVLKTDDQMLNYDKDIEEKIGKLYVMQGSKPIEVSELHAGDIGALAKLTGARTGNTLSTKSTPIEYGKTEISVPYTSKRYKAKNKGDIDKISQSLTKMTHEDLTLRVVNDSENHQSLLYGMGDCILSTSLIATYDFWDKTIYSTYLEDIFAIRAMDAFIDDSVEVTAEDKIITLSTGVTGEDDKRYLVQAVLVSE